MMNHLYPCFWYDGKAREAAEFYCSVFGDSRITWGNDFAVTFELSGQKFMSMNGGPGYTINPSISVYTVIETESEIKRIWDLLADQGSVLMAFDKYPWSDMFGWVQDRYGLSWQLTLGWPEEVGQKFTPLLLFTQNHSGQAEEAIKFYTSVFRNSSVAGISRYTKDEDDVEGNIKHAEFRLGNYLMMAMESSLPHQFTFNEAVSLVVDCKDQDEIDHFWTSLTSGGVEKRSGWLRDKFGIFWQILPEILPKLMSDPVKAERVATAFSGMKKFDIRTLVNA